MTLLHITKDPEATIDGIDQKNGIQPNAVDLSIEAVARIDMTSDFVLRREDKLMRATEEIYADTLPNYNFVGFVLSPGTYQFETTSYVEIPEGRCGWLKPRSTLIRNGVRVHSGLYDAGYMGRVGGIIVTPGPLIIEVGSRIAQFIYAEAETVSLYEGVYNEPRS